MAHKRSKRSSERMSGGRWKPLPRAWLLLLLTLAAVCCLNACGAQELTAQENEILLDIQLDTADDIGLLLINWDGGGSRGSGGSSNADKTLLKHDERFTWALERAAFEHPDNLETLALDFGVVTQYVEPNYEDVYPADITYYTDSISFDAEFGNVYHVRISGSPEDGFTAAYDPESRDAA